MADEITTFYSRTQEKCDTEANWEAANPILLKNEVIYVKMTDGDTRTKTGDGTSRYKSLPFNDKNFREKVNGKVDKVSGKGLSTNDFTSTYKTKLDNLDTNLNNKVDKVSGKGLSTNDFTGAYKSKLDNLDSKLNAKAPAYSYSTTDLTAGTSTLATGKLYFVYE